MASGRIDRTFVLMFIVMLTIAAGNTALQSVLPALGRSLGMADAAVGAAFSISALLWVVAAPFWANRLDRYGRRAMILLGLGGFTLSLLLCGLFLALGINGAMGPAAVFVAFMGGRVLYGVFGCAAPPAVQAIVAGRTALNERTRALALLASAFGLGTILGPALAPYLRLGSLWDGGPHVGLAGPAFVFAAFGMCVWIAVRRLLPGDAALGGGGAASSYPSIGGAPTGASVTAGMAAQQAEAGRRVGFFDPRIRSWLILGLGGGHAQAMTGQAIGFLVIDRLNVAPEAALEPTGLVLMMGAGAALLVQWGLIPLLNLTPARLIQSGLVVGAVGCAATGTATSLYGIATGFALASMGFGLLRPGFTAGASLAVPAELQGSVAGKVTSVNGAAFVLGPSIGVGLYALWRPLPYLSAAAMLVVLLGYAFVSLRAAPARSPTRPPTEYP